MQYLSFKNRSLQLVGKYKQLWQFYIKIALLFFYETLVFPSKIVMQGNFIFKDLWFLVKIKPPLQLQQQVAIVLKLITV